MHFGHNKRAGIVAISLKLLLVQSMTLSLSVLFSGDSSETRSICSFNVLSGFLAQKKASLQRLTGKLQTSNYSSYNRRYRGLSCGAVRYKNISKLTISKYSVFGMSYYFDKKCLFNIQFNKLPNSKQVL